MANAKNTIPTYLLLKEIKGLRAELDVVRLLRTQIDADIAELEAQIQELVVQASKRLRYKLPS